MWKTKDGYTLTMPQSELETLASRFSGSGCGCKGCAIKAVAEELDHFISGTTRMPKSRLTVGARRTTRGARSAKASARRSPSLGRSDTFAGRTGSSVYQFQTKRLPGKRRVIYAYTPPPWANGPPPQPAPPSPDCAPDDPSCAQAPDGSGAPDGDDSGELGETILGALMRGG
jgi:hypothetical protein